MLDRLGPKDHKLFSLFELRAGVLTYDVECHALKIAIDRLPKLETAILELDSRHFVAFVGMHQENYLIVDPNRGEEQEEWSRARLTMTWTGSVLAINLRRASGWDSGATTDLE